MAQTADDHTLLPRYRRSEPAPPAAQGDTPPAARADQPAGRDNVETRVGHLEHQVARLLARVAQLERAG